MVLRIFRRVLVLVADSVPEAEYIESLNKAKALMASKGDGGKVRMEDAAMWCWMNGEFMRAEDLKDFSV